MKWCSILGLLFLLVACKSKGTEEVVKPKALFEIPSNFPEPVYLLDKNPITQGGFDLGKTLFYDGILSRDSTIACGECHRQYYGFTHHLHDLSHGIGGRTGLRNALGIQNVAWETSYMWDGLVTDLDQQPLVPIQHPDEMDNTMDDVLMKLRRSKTYPALFKAAFGSEEITTDRVFKSLTQFMLTLVSANSRYDKYTRKETGATLTSDELAGMQLFQSKGCGSCHSGELFTDRSFRNNGVSPYERMKVVYVDGKPTLQLVVDKGRATVTQQTDDEYKFKVPSLRNIEASLPYMHDGRFTTLKQVLDFYSSGMYDFPNLDPIFRKNTTIGIPMTEDEKLKIIAFLNTLTDTEFLTDKRFSEPEGFPVR